MGIDKTFDCANKRAEELEHPLAKMMRSVCGVDYADDAAGASLSWRYVDSVTAVIVEV